MAKHVHRYERVIFGKNNYVVYKCNLPTCNHYISVKFVEGKLTLCNRCGEQMILDKRAMKFVKPYCVNCVHTKKKESHDRLLEFLEQNLL